MKEFELFTDTKKMKAVFEQHLQGFDRHQTKIAELSIAHIWYKIFRQRPEKSFLTILYKLKISGAHECEQMLYAKAYLQNRSSLEFNAHLNQRLTAPVFGAALSHLPEQDMVVWSFPNDPALTFLAELIDPEKVKKHLPFCPETIEKISNVNLEIVNYRPELRCTTKYELQTDSSTQTIFAKTFADESGAEIFERMKILNGEASLTGFKIARPLRYQNSLHTIWQEGFSGRPVIEVLNINNYRNLANKIAGGLAALHRSKIISRNHITSENQIAELTKKITKLITAFPQFKTRLQTALHEVEANQPRQHPLQIIHGDFHINQLLMNNDRLALFDFDEFAMGDPLQDLANFIVDLYAQNLGPALVAATSAYLCGAYQNQTKQPISPERLDWHLRVQFLTRAYRCYWQRKPAVENLISFYLDLLPHKVYQEAA